jgi:uncharacterized protein YbaP (TraB family)
MSLSRLWRGFAVALVAGFLALNAAAQADNPALWQVSGAKGKVYFFGSFHLLPPDVQWRTPTLQRALEEARAIVFEVDVAGAQDAQIMQPLLLKYGMLPAGHSLQAMLPPKLNAEFEGLANELRVPPAQLGPMRPWLAALLLAVQFMASQGYDPKMGVEPQLAAWAKENRKQQLALESTESQFRMFADLTREEEIQFFAVSIRQIRETPRMLDDILAAYRKGDLVALEKTLNAGLDEMPTLRKRVLAERHRQWLPQIEKMMADGRTHVVVVGAAHLVGPDSVIAMLRARGHKVQGP